MRRTLGLAVGISAALVLPAAAQPATPQAQASALAAEGGRLYGLPDYAGAAAKFDAAYALDPLPSYEFNAAQAYRLAEICDKAADRYQRFLDTAKDVQNLDKVREYLEHMRACSKPREVHPPVAPPVVPPPVAPPIARVDPIAPAPAPGPADHRWMRRGGIALGGLGVAALVVGAGEADLVSYWSGRSHDCDQVPDNAHAACPSTNVKRFDDRGAARTRDMRIAFGVGGAAIAGGVILYVLGRDPETAQITPTAGGAVVSARFRF